MDQQELHRPLSPVQCTVTLEAATEPSLSRAHLGSSRRRPYRSIVCQAPLFDSLQGPRPVGMGLRLAAVKPPAGAVPALEPAALLAGRRA